MLLQERELHSTLQDVQPCSMLVIHSSVNQWMFAFVQSFLPMGPLGWGMRVPATSVKFSSDRPG